MYPWTESFSVFQTKAAVHWHAPKLTGILPSRADFPMISFEAGVNVHSFHSEAFTEFQEALSSLNWLIPPFSKGLHGCKKKKKKSNEGPLIYFQNHIRVVSTSGLCAGKERW